MGERIMKRIPQAVKEALVKKALNQPGINLKKFAASNNIGYSSLAKWMKGYANFSKGSSPVNHEISAKERFQHVLETASLDEEALGAYCRERGLYVAQLHEWKKELVEKNDDEKKQALQAELKRLRMENAQLKQEVRRKDKALAETAALLVLKKKVDAIWGEPEDV